MTPAEKLAQIARGSCFGVGPCRSCPIRKECKELIYKLCDGFSDKYIRELSGLAQSKLDQRNKKNGSN